MSATGQPTEGAPPAVETGAESAAPEAAPTTTTEPGGLDRLYSRMDEMATEQRQFMESVTQQLAPPEEEDEQEFYDESGEMTEAGARQVLADLVDERVNAQLAPREAARLVEMRDDAFEALKDEYPDLQDEQVARRVLDKAVTWAHQSGNEKLIDHPAFVDVIESFFKADKFDELRASQEAEQPRPVVLESASGAARQQPRQQEIDWQKRVIDAAQADGPRI